MSILQPSRISSAGKSNLPNKSNARGKNGWFIPAEMLGWIEDSATPRAVIEVYSSTHGEMAPIILDLLPRDLEILANLVRDLRRQMPD